MANLYQMLHRLQFAGASRSWCAAALLSFFLGGGLAVSDSSGAVKKPVKTASKTAAKSKPASKGETADESAQLAGLDLDEELSALVVPARLLPKVNEADKLKYSQELRGLLVEGINANGDGLEAARKHYEAAHRLAADDPRVAYAYGLALVTQKKTAIALEQFRSAGRSKKVAFLPGLQGIAWMSLVRDEDTQAHLALRDLAHRLEESQETWPTAEDKEHSAEWLGRMIGFLVGPGKTADQAAPVEALANEISTLLTAERKQAYDAGLKSVAARYDELKASAARPAEELLAEARQKQEDLLAAAATAASEAKALEDELRALKKPHDKQLADLSREIRSKAAIIKSASSKLDGAEEEVTELSVPKLHPQMKSGGLRQGAKVVGRKENAGEQKIRESQLASAQKRLDQLNASLEEARQRIADARKERDQARAEFHTGTADKRKALHTAQHRAAEFSSLARDVEHGTLTPALLKARVTALESYVPLYPELEKARLLATLTPAS